MDQERIEHALDACYEAVAAPDAWGPALDALNGALGASAVTFYRKEFTAESAPVPSSTGYEDLLSDFVKGGWYENHYRAERGWPMLKAGRGVIVEHDLATDEERRRLRHYNDFYLRWGYPGFAAVGFEVGGKQWAIAMLRNHEQGFFQPDEAERMAMLGRHFQRMVRLAGQFESAGLSTSLAALEKQGKAAAIISADGRLFEMNTCCAELIARAPRTLAVRNGVLSALEPEAQRRFDRLVRMLLSPDQRDRRAAHANAVALPRPERLPLIVEGMALAALGLKYSFGEQVILLFADPEKAPPPAAHKFRAALGLTPAESEFARLLADGASLGTIAAAQGITRETARYRLKGIFAKSGTHRQGELVSLLTRLAR